MFFVNHEDEDADKSQKRGENEGEEEENLVEKITLLRSMIKKLTNTVGRLDTTNGILTRKLTKLTGESFTVEMKVTEETTPPTEAEATTSPPMEETEDMDTDFVPVLGTDISSGRDMEENNVTKKKKKDKKDATAKGRNYSINSRRTRKTNRDQETKGH